MIALDTNVLARYLVRDNTEQAEAARSLLESLTADLPGYVCREVTVELAWVLKRAYGYSRDQIATVLEELVATEGSGADRIVGAIRPGVRRGDAAYAAMT